MGRGWSVISAQRKPASSRAISDGHDGGALALLGEVSVALEQTDLRLPGRSDGFRTAWRVGVVGGGSARRLRSAAGGRAGCRSW